MEKILTDLLAPVAGGRRFWLRAPQGAGRPYVVMQQVGGSPSYTMRGASGHSTGRFQIDVYDDLLLDAKSVMADIKTILSGHSGGAVQGIFIDSERTLPAADAGDVNTLARASIDIIIHHGETP